MSPQQAEFLLRDLGRWIFGRILAERADFKVLDPDILGVEVRAYRYGILCTILKDPSLRKRALAEPLVAAPWELMCEWMDLSRELSWDAEAEVFLAGHFVARLEAVGTVGEAMRRFARGKASKYGKRVVGLNEQFRAS